MHCPAVLWLDELITLLLSVIFHVHMPTDADYAAMFQRFYDESDLG